MKHLIVLFSLLVGNSAMAYTCSDYATRAVAQEKAAMNMFCGYSGPRWATAWQGHFAWCNAVSVGTAIQEDLARQQGLEACLQKPLPPGNCNAYAARAVEQYNANVDLGCGQSGPRWQGNLNAHKLFCTIAQGNWPLVAGEDAARISELQVCVTQ